MIIKCTVAYDGWAYAGWQKQENALGIQEIIESALEKIHKKPTSIVASGRTDAKVHALGQVFHFESDGKIQPVSYVRALNSLLPLDIRIQSAEKAEDDFHARFSCRSKRYLYIATKNQRDPFACRTKGVLYQDLNIEKMIEACHILIGTHDFTTFSSSRIDPRKSRVKTIKMISIEKRDQDYHFLFEGNGFLRYQVRMMTGTLIEVGKETITPQDVQKMLDLKDKEACRYNASPQGLYLMEVCY